MSENELSFRSLNEIEIADLNLQLARLKQIAADVGVQLFADGREPDLDVLSLLASDLKWPEHETAIILVGLAFGQILAAGAPLSWGLEKNEWGEEMSLKLAGYEVFIHPISMTIKRLEKGEKIDFRYLFDQLLQQFRTIDPRTMPTRN